VCYVATAAIAGNWQDYLRVDENRTELFEFLSQALLQWFDEEDKQIVITNRHNVFSHPRLTDVGSSLLQPRGG